MTTAGTAKRHATGVARLDDVLRGGLPSQSWTLLYGPPFLGKDVLARKYLLEGWRRGEPGIMVLTDESATNERAAFAAMDPSFAKYEQAGLVQFVDAYSRSIGAVEVDGHVEYVDGAMDLNGVSLGLNNAERKVLPDHPEHRVVFDSISTLITFTNPQTVFRFLQVLVGRTRLAGAAGLLLMDAGMHSDAEVQTFKHLMNGVIEVRPDNGKNMVRADGVGIMDNPGWVEYRFDETRFELIGSFASGRIR